MRRWIRVLRTPLGLAATVLTLAVLVLAVVWTAARVLCGREGSMGPA